MSLTGAVLFVCALWITWYQLQPYIADLVWYSLWQSVFSAFSSYALWLLLLILSVANVAAETWKWKAVTEGVYPLSWQRAFTAVLAGMASGFVTPHRVGEVIGRAFWTEGKMTAKSLSLALEAGLVQGAVTLWTGTLALCAVMAAGWLPFSWAWLSAAALLVLASLALVLAFVFPQFVSRCLQKLPRWRRGKKEKASRTLYWNHGRDRLWYFLQIATLRYAVFLLQYLILLSIFEVQGATLFLAAMVAVIFLCASFVPSPFLGKLGIREAVAVSLLGTLTGQPVEVLAASFSLWVLNQVLPALCGAVVWLLSKKSTFA